MQHSTSIYTLTITAPVPYSNTSCSVTERTVLTLFRHKPPSRTLSAFTLPTNLLATNYPKLAPYLYASEQLPSSDAPSRYPFNKVLPLGRYPPLSLSLTHPCSRYPFL